jgi:hypothetical protein
MQFAGVNQTHKEIAHLSAVHRLIKKGSGLGLAQGLKSQLAQTACFQIYGISRAHRGPDAF